MLNVTLSEPEIDALRKHLPILINSLDKGITDLNLEIASQEKVARARFISHRNTLQADLTTLAGIFEKL